LHNERGTAHEMLTEAADTASGSAQAQTCAGPPSARSTPKYTTSTSPLLSETPELRSNSNRLSYHADHIQPRRTATGTQPPGKPRRYFPEAH